MKIMKIALGIEYDGHGFHGWQRQENLPTVQATLENALSKIADEKIIVHCAGRTDAGVHALGQVIHFETTATRDPRAWTLGVNTALPNAVSVRWMQTVDDEFHARFSAIARRYRYLILNHSLRSALFSHRATWYYHSLDIQIMQQAASQMIGEHDFSSFRSAECESLSPMRHVKEISITRHGHFVSIEIEANAFLHHMVRNIAGVLMKIGSGIKEPDWVSYLLTVKDRKEAAETAPAHGLYLVQVKYPSRYSFSHNLDPMFLF